MLAPLMFVRGIFQSAAFTSLVSLAGQGDKSVRGAVLAVNASAVVFGAALGTIFMSWIYARFGIAIVGICCSAVTALASALVFAWLRPRFDDVDVVEKRNR